MSLEKEASANHSGATVGIEMPAPTAWPFILAFGLTLLFAGLLTSAYISALGAVLSIAGCVGWFRQVLPHEHHETVPIGAEVAPTPIERRQVVRFAVDIESHRARLPI